MAKELGPIDILINNAGIAEPCAIEKLTEDQSDRTLALNLKSAFLCSMTGQTVAANGGLHLN